MDKKVEYDMEAGSTEGLPMSSLDPQTSTTKLWALNP